LNASLCSRSCRASSSVNLSRLASTYRASGKSIRTADQSNDGGASNCAQFSEKLVVRVHAVAAAKEVRTKVKKSLSFVGVGIRYQLGDAGKSETNVESSSETSNEGS
jgi:hypothetical protein